MSDGPAPTVASILPADGVIQLSKAARQCFRKHDYEQARSLYLRGLAIEPQNPYLLSGLGDACRELGDFGGSQEAYQTLLTLEPNNLFALRGMGDLLKGKGLVEEAISYWVRYLRLRPEDVHVMSRLADAFKHLENNSQAEDLYRNILQIDSMDRFALTGLADLLHRTGRDLEAIACYEQILTLKEDPLHVLTIVGNLCWRISDIDKAEGFFLQALVIDPVNPYALYGLGNCYRWQRNYTQALEVWQRILQHHPGTAALYSRLGDAFTHLGDLSSAEQAYRKVLDQGYDRFAQLGFVKLLCDQGDFSRAVEELNALLAHEQDPWSQIDELSRRFVNSGQRDAMIRFFHRLLESSSPNGIDPERIKNLLKRLDPSK